MTLSILDVSLFILFFVIVVGVSMYKSRKEATGEDFFLASRGVIWPLIGLSLIAANISTEHFVGVTISAVIYSGALTLHTIFNTGVPGICFAGCSRGIRFRFGF